jgi:hypothetical protein
MQAVCLAKRIRFAVTQCISNRRDKAPAQGILGPWKTIGYVGPANYRICTAIFADMKDEISIPTTPDSIEARATAAEINIDNVRIEYVVDIDVVDTARLLNVSAAIYRIPIRRTNGMTECPLAYGNPATVGRLSFQIDPREKQPR